MADSVGDLERQFELIIQQLKDDLQDLRKRGAAGKVDGEEISSRMAVLRALGEAERTARARRPIWPTNTCWAFANLAVLDVSEPVDRAGDESGKEGDERHINADSIIRFEVGADRLRSTPTNQEAGVFRVEGDLTMTELPPTPSPEERFKHLGL
jgi:hypothetical protein